jgi:diacylglycerol kinase family enzyme
MTVAPPAKASSALKAFLNAACGNAEAAREAIAAAGFELEAVQPKELEKCLQKAIGEGTIATAAALVAKTRTELAILPGGTLNHFAKDHGIPTDLGKAALFANDGPIVPADIGYVNNCVFLNTSSLGAYVTFVRERERLERYFGYSIASVIAFAKMLSEIRTFSVTLEVEGEKKTYRASLVFIGVGERELKLPILGNRVKNGRRGLHVMVVQGRKPARLFALALAGITKGRYEADKLPEFDEFLVDSCRIDLTRPTATICPAGRTRSRSQIDWRKLSAIDTS